MKRVSQFLLRHELLIMMLCLVAILRLPSLMEPYWYGDEGIYLTLGNGIRHGLALYRDIHDNKPPVIYYLAAFAGSEFWFKFLLLAWNLVSVAVFAWIAQHLLNPEKKDPQKKIMGIDFPVPTLATFATLLFALLPFEFEGNIANGEIFMILPTLIGMALLLHLRDLKHPKLMQKIFFGFWAGVSLSLAFLTKVPAAFDAVAAGLYFYLLVPQTHIKALRKRAIGLVRSLFSLPPWVFGLAFLLPLGLTIAYYTLIGAGQPYIQAALLQNVGYLSSWKTGSFNAQNVTQTGLKSRALGIGALTVLLFICAPFIDTDALFVVIWFGFAWFGALLSERPYPHYLIQVVPPLALLLPLFLKLILKIRWKTIRHQVAPLLGSLGLIGCGVLLAVSMITIKFWHYPQLPYYENYIKFVTGKITKDTYFSYFDPHLPEEYMLSEYIMKNTTPDDRIFIWGDLPSMYALTRRLPPGRYTSEYHIKDFNGFEETFAAITKVVPKFILIDRSQDAFPKLQPLLDEEYVVAYQSQTFILYRYLPGLQRQ